MGERFLVAYGLDLPNQCLHVAGRREMEATLRTLRACGFAVAVHRLNTQEHS